MKIIFAWMCVFGAVGSFLYALFSFFKNRDSDRDASLKSTLRTVSTGHEDREKVKESSRILDPSPEMSEKMSRPTEADEAYVTGERHESDMEEYVEAEEVEEAEAVEEDNFMSGLDEDVESNYIERQDLDSDEAPVEEAEPLEDSVEDEVFNVSAEYSENEPYSGDFTGSSGVADMPAVDPDNISGEEVPEELPESDDTDKDHQETEWAEQPSDVNATPEPQDVSEAFHRLEQEADIDEGPPRQEEQTDTDTEEEPEDDEEEKNGEQNLFD